MLPANKQEKMILEKCRRIFGEDCNLTKTIKMENRNGDVQYLEIGENQKLRIFLELGYIPQNIMDIDEDIENNFDCFPVHQLQGA